MFFFFKKNNKMITNHKKMAANVCKASPITAGKDPHGGDGDSGVNPDPAAAAAATDTAAEAEPDPAAVDDGGGGIRLGTSTVGGGGAGVHGSIHDVTVLMSQIQVVTACWLAAQSPAAAGDVVTIAQISKFIELNAVKIMAPLGRLGAAELAAADTKLLPAGSRPLLLDAIAKRMKALEPAPPTDAAAAAAAAAAAGGVEPAEGGRVETGGGGGGGGGGGESDQLGRTNGDGAGPDDARRSLLARARSAAWRWARQLKSVVLWVVSYIRAQLETRGAMTHPVNSAGFVLGALAALFSIRRLIAWIRSRSAASTSAKYFWSELGWTLEQFFAGVI